MKLNIVRHGETNENKDTKLMGRSQGELSENGKEQAIKTGKVLSQENIDIIFTSPLDRCVDTSNLINQSLKKEIIKDDLLLERDFGQLTNSTHADIDFDALDTPSDKNTQLGVEPLSSVRIRTEDFINKIKQDHPNDSVLVVGHNNPIRMMLGVLLNASYHDILSKYKIHNCGITVFEISPNVVKIEKIDNIDHLE